MIAPTSKPPSAVHILGRMARGGQTVERCDSTRGASKKVVAGGCIASPHMILLYSMKYMYSNCLTGGCRAEALETDGVHVPCFGAQYVRVSPEVLRSTRQRMAYGARSAVSN